ncbi:DNA (cytosine-5)-methyltransferase CMT2 isoform X2 [Beta vulgaris subsp. vulgaris]|uniref:DNA (cytosine-5)-methyltransferase CMT2 isoform X2 n=1 Tax=Beta vulgaris subsp. vulgaris TaxID=3555 RepID=UPI002036E8E5|nr:DNA (cytosine-5)-methyltransferase CMT2 isoform X2 [Beta vulgaris subsp. vulgaris]
MHQSLRRSPRLILSPPQQQQQQQQQQLLALTLHDNEDQKKPTKTHILLDQHYSFCTPQPLKIRHPKKQKTKILFLTSSSAAISLRKSPRLAASSNGVTSSSTLSNSSPTNVRSSASSLHGKRKLNSMETPLKTNNIQLHAPEFVRRSPRVSASKPALKLIKYVKCEESKKIKVDDRESVRRSPRFSSSKSEKNAALELMKYVECEESEGKLGMESVSLLIEEEKVLRRSPRELPSSLGVDDECDEFELGYSLKKTKKKKKKAPKEEEIIERREKIIDVSETRKNCFFIGDPVPQEEALQKWGCRYQFKNRRINGGSLAGNAREENEPTLEVKCHYTQAEINGCIFHLGDCALIRGENQKHIGRIIEFFETMDREDYFRVQWFYKPEDTVMKEEASFHDKKRIFYSSIMNDNLLACIISKLNVIQVSHQLNMNSSSIEPSDFYYDMEYCLEYSTFRNLPRGDSLEGCKLPSLSCPESILPLTSSPVAVNRTICKTYNPELTMLDIYAGCGGMSTGLCMGAKHSGINLVTRWAIDADSSACESLRLNHSNIRIMNETADDFLELLKHWERLCKKYVIEETHQPFSSPQKVSDLAEASSDAQSNSDTEGDELEVLGLVDIRYGDADGSGKEGLQFKVRWKGFGPSEDTWEPIDGLSNCQDLIQEFVINGFKKNILPLPELPQFPLPTHDVVVRYYPPSEFERNIVAYDEGAQPPELEDAVFLGDAISDLPAVTNYESLDAMPYSRPPETEFQKYIRSTKYDMCNSASTEEEAVLYDHRPHQLFEDDYIRVCQIPQRKGANFRDLPGVIVGDDNVVRRDLTQETVLLPSGRPMVPEYAFTFEQGKSKRPFARLWWDETMPTIVTYPNCHSQAVLHPEQDRVLSVRECARLQGFPDNYRFSGTVKKRYRQVGNAVAVPVAKALGYALGMASQRLIDKEPLLTLPPKFAYSTISVCDV